MNKAFRQTSSITEVQARRRLRIGVFVILAFVGFLEAAGVISAAPAYPVKKGPTGRYLVDQNGVPFLIAGESPQSMIGNLSEEDAELFFANRRTHGFNTVYIDLLCNQGTGCRPDGSTFDGILPFTVPNDFSTPNEAYFARADRILRLAAQYGFLVMLNPAETIGWLGIMQSNGVDKSRAYGQFLGRRYANFDNIVWLHGNDYNFEQLPTAEMDAVTTAVALGIKDFDNLFDRSGNLLLTMFVLNADFRDLKVFSVNQTGSRQIGIGGTETSGLVRGPAYQVFDSAGNLSLSRFVLNPDF
jgi:hypothetical protein